MCVSTYILKFVFPSIFVLRLALVGLEFNRLRPISYPLSCLAESHRTAEKVDQSCWGATLLTVNELKVPAK